LPIVTLAGLPGRELCRENRLTIGLRDIGDNLPGLGPEPIETPELKATIEKVVPHLMQEGDVPGLSLVLIQNGDVVYSHGFGVKNAATTGAVDTDTVFEAASLSKPVFAYAVLKLVDAGKLDLDTPLVKYLPGAYVENDSRINLITARMVMDHSTGFPNWRGFGKPLKIYFDPGSRFSYSGEGFVFLQKVVEHITGRSLNEVIRDLVLDPLGMTSSSYVWQDAYESRIAVGHSQAAVPRPVRKPSEPNAAASLHTTASDYARFVAALLNGARLNQIAIKPETRKQMLTPQIKVSAGCVNCTFAALGPPSDQLSWGLGVGLQQTGLGPSFWHWGDNNSEYQCFMVGFPDKAAGLVIFTNSGNGLSIIPEIISTVFGIGLPAFGWLHYDPYNSPARLFLKSILVEGAVAVLTRYRQARSSGKSEALSEAQMNSIGYWLLQKEKPNDAAEVFKQNVVDHPTSANAYDSLGEAYLKLGQNDEAAKNYRKSLELNPENANAAQILKRLEAK
jgi:CubicO group peptidase (beta-lactamase class C family)